MIARFWWGSTKEKRKISWVAWRKLARPKTVGGLGFRDLHLFNQALLANHIQRPHSLLYRLLKARYFRDGTFLTASRGTQPSYGWNSLRFGRDLLKTRIQTSIGDGKTTSIGNDSWLPTNPPRPPTMLPMTNPELKVEDLIDKRLNQWDTEALKRLIHPEDHHIIHKKILPPHSAADSYIWSPAKNGAYSVKSGYWTVINLEVDDESPKPPLATDPDIANNSIWKLQITPKLRHFLWRFVSRAIGIAENLRRRNMNVNPYCSRCCTAVETSDHALFSCPQVTMIWRATGIPIHLICNPDITIEEKLRYIFQIHNNAQVEQVTRYLPLWLMWRIWKSRNDLVFNRRTTSHQETVKQATTDTKEWLDNLVEQPTVNEQPQQHHSRKAKWRPPI